MIKKLYKRSCGGAALETAIALPVVCYLIFFIFEAIRVNTVQSAIDAITYEASFSFIASSNTSNFAAIISKHRPNSIPATNIKWYFCVYKDLDTMCKTSPYGSEEPFWPTGDSSISGTEYIDIDGNGSLLARLNSLSLSNYKTPEVCFSSSNTNADFKSLTGKVFVLTFVCDYKFTNALVKKLFSGGSNTAGRSKFLIWCRGLGICN